MESMKKMLWMDCEAVRESIWEGVCEREEDAALSLLERLLREVHLVFCSACAGEYHKKRCLEAVLKDDFFPPAPRLEDQLMERLDDEAFMPHPAEQAGFSLRSWVIIGFFVLLSLGTVFFGLDFINIAAEEGLSFLLPVGLTIGMILTCYGALFIGSHLKELSDRFRLR